MREHKAAGPVRSFLRRVALQIVVSGTAMGAIHFGAVALPSLSVLFAPAEPMTAEATAALDPPVRPETPESRLPAIPFAAAPVVEATQASVPVPEPAPPRPVHQTADRAAAEKVARFDACDPACPSRDPLLARGMPILASAAAALPVSEFPEALDAGAASRPEGMLGLPGRALSATARTAKGAWSKVGALLPF